MNTTILHPSSVQNFEISNYCPAYCSSDISCEHEVTFTLVDGRQFEGALPNEHINYWISLLATGVIKLNGIELSHFNAHPLNFVATTQCWLYPTEKILAAILSK